jgi:opacity protein-like surface antigen
MKINKLKVIAYSVVFFTLAIEAGKNVEPVEVPVVPVACPTGFYIGAGGTYHNLSKDCPCAGGGTIHDNTYGGTVRFGYDFNRYFGLEGRGVYTGGGDGFLDDMWHLGAYLKPQLPIGDSFNIYGLLGYGFNKLNCNCFGSHSHSIASPSFGGGFEYHFGDIIGEKREGWGIWADAQNLMWNEDDGAAKNLKSTIFSAGIMYNF